MKLGMKVLMGLTFSAAVMAVAPASATNFLTGTAGVVWECNGACSDASAIPPATFNAMSTFTPGAINYDSNTTGYTIGQFLNGATLTGTALPGDALDNTLMQITGTVHLGAGNNPFNLVHDDGAQLFIPGIQAAPVFSEPGPTSAVTNIFNVNAASAGDYTFILNYNECCGAPAVLGLSVAPTPGPLPGAGLPGLAVLALVGGWAWVRKFA